MSGIDVVRSRIMKDAFQSGASLDAPRRLLAVIELYANAVQVTVTNHEAIDGGLTCKPVSLASLMMAFNSNVSVSSGILPDNALFWLHGLSGPVVGVFYPAHRRHVLYEDNTYYLPLPPMILAGVGFDAYLYALKTDGRPSADSMLYFPPLPNIFDSCRVCKGQNAWGEITAANINDVWEEFWRSEFTAHLVANRATTYPVSVADLWAVIDGNDEFPHRELVTTHSTLKEIM